MSGIFLPDTAEIFAYNINLPAMMKQIFLLIVFFVIQLQNSFSQWNSIGPSGGEIKALLAINDTIFAGGINGIYKSINNGYNWENESIGILPPYVVKKFIISDSIIFAGTDQGLFQYQFTSRKWELIFPTAIVDIVISQYNNVTKIALTDGNNIYIKSIADTKWMSLKNQTLAENIFSIGILKDYIFFSGNNGLFQAQLDTLKWNGPFPPGKVNNFTTIKDTIYCSSSNGLWFYGYRTKQWTGTSFGFCSSAILSYDTLLVASSCVVQSPTESNNSNLFTSKDKTNWKQLPSINNNPLAGNFQAYSVNSIALNKKYIFIANTYSGVLRIANSQKKWLEVSNDLNNLNIANLKKVKTLFSTSSGNLFWSKDQGKSWTSSSEGLLEDPVTHQKGIFDYLEFQDTIYANAIVGFSKKNFNDSIWISYKSGNFSAFPSSYQFRNTKSQLYIFGDSRIYRITNDSNQLYYTASGSPFQKGFTIKDFAISESGTEYLIDDSTLYFRDSNVSPWISATFNVKSNGFKSIILLGDTVLIITQSGTYISFKGKESFISNFPTGITFQKIICVDKKLFALIQNNHFAYSPDLGKTWRKISISLSDQIIVTDIAADHDFLYAGTNGASVWKYSLANLFSPSVSNQNLSTNISANSAQISSTGNSNGYATNFYLQYSTNKSFPDSLTTTFFADSATY